jgi:dihydrofolate reductase
MRTLSATAFTSLDGVVQAPGGPGEDDDGGFPFGGWTVPFFDEDLGQAMGAWMAEPFDLVLGRRTYDVFAAFWPNAPAEEGGDIFNGAAKHVASRGGPELSWEGSSLLEGDVVDAVRALKEQDGRPLQVHGSFQLLEALLAAGLVDRLQVLTFPVLLGQGKRLFREGVAPRSLRLEGSSVSGTGVVVARYAVAGEVRTGSFSA